MTSADQKPVSTPKLYRVIPNSEYLRHANVRLLLHSLDTWRDFAKGEKAEKHPGNILYLPFTPAWSSLPAAHMPNTHVAIDEA